MHQSIRGSDSPGWIHGEEVFQEVHGTFGHFSDITFFQRFWSGNLMEFHAQETWILAEHLLLLVCQGSKDLLDHVELVDLVVAWEQGLTVG